MRLLNSGTLNRGRNLCVTVAFDHSTVDGFHDELQLSAKNSWGKALRRTSWVKEFYLVRWSDYHSISIPPIREHSITRITPRIRLVRGWEVWKGTLMVADLEQVDKNRRVRIPQRKAQREGGDLDQIGDNSKNRRWTIKIYWRRSGSENSNLDKVSSKFEEKFKKTFLENQTGFHHRPKQEVIAHQHSLYRDQRYPHPSCFEKCLGKLVMNLFNKQTCAVYYR